MCLIPKVKNHVSITQYSPISLCNTTYKIIVNRLKPFLPKIIGPTQSNFQQGKKASDNAIIVQELLHHLKRKKKGRIGHMLLKLDLEKAFDKLEWSFIYTTLHHFNLPNNIIFQIMSYVST